MSIPGIDAGNWRFKYSVCDEAGNPKTVTNRFGESSTPSAVYIGPDGQAIVGTEALNAGFADPAGLVTNWKRTMGTDKVLLTTTKGKTYKSKDILAILFMDAKDNLEAKTGQVVNEAVVTVPANYTDAQKQETIEAAAEAGIKAILLPHEPTAAALGNGLHKRKNCTAVLYDFGGSTFDVSILRNEGNSCKIIATDGDPNVGGRDINDCAQEELLEIFAAEHGFRPTREKHPVFFQDMMTRIEQLKISLSVQPTAQIVLFCEGKQLQLTITREQFNDWIRHVVAKTIEKTTSTINEANLEVAQIDEVLAVGGSSLIPLVHEQLELALGKKVSQQCEPHCAAAHGAVLAGRLEYQRQGKDYTKGGVVLPPPDFLVQEILSHSIGVLALDQENREQCSEILAKDTPIPSIQTKVFRLSEPNQTAVTIRVLEGPDGTDAKDCLALGHFDLNDLPPRPDMIGRIEVTFSLDKNGILTAKARDNASGKTAEMTVDYDVSNKGTDAQACAA